MKTCGIVMGSRDDKEGMSDYDVSVMAKRKITNALYDSRFGGEAIRLESLQVDDQTFQPARTNYFSIYLIESGSGHFWADAAKFSFGPDSLLFFVPYQRIRLEIIEPVRGEVIQFHANFLCVETFHAEVGCSGVLFNDPYGVPAVQLEDATRPEVMSLVERLRQEDAERHTAFHEVMLSYLKVLLVLATRLKSSTPAACDATEMDLRNPVLIELTDMIEQNYCTLHSPSDYAKLLHITPKTLGRIVRENLGTTPTELIRGRILTHAKWHLLHTLKPVKQIARELGFKDELYFSRLFKKSTGYSPTFFREFETEIRGGSNLSMFSSDPTILDAEADADTASKTNQKSKPTGT